MKHKSTHIKRCLLVFIGSHTSAFKKRQGCGGNVIKCVVLNQFQSFLVNLKAASSLMLTDDLKPSFPMHILVEGILNILNRKQGVQVRKNNVRPKTTPGL